MQKLGKYINFIQKKIKIAYDKDKNQGTGFVP